MTLKIRLIILAVNLTFYIILTAPSVFAEDGDIIWTFTPAGSNISYPAIGTDGTLYVGSSKETYWEDQSATYVYAINPDGTQKWVFSTGTVDESFVYPAQPALGADGTIYVGTLLNKLYALNTDGTLKWQYDFEADDSRNVEVDSALAIANDGTIYVGVNPDNLYAINPDGTKKWSLDTWIIGTWSKHMGPPVIAADGTIYVVAEPTGLHAFNPDGTVKWKSSEFHFNRDLAIGDDETIYAKNLDGLIAFNQNGSIKWIFEGFTSRVSKKRGSPVVGTDGTIYVGLCCNNDFYAINPDGTKKWSIQPDSYYNTIGADGNIYTETAVLNPDGTINWTLYISKPTLGSDGTLYGTSNDGLSAFETSSNGPADSSWPMFQYDLRRTGSKVAYYSNFADVPPGYWAEEFIGKIYEAGITSGCSQNPLMYCPKDPVTRAEMAVFLERGINGSDYDPPGATGIFDDCPVSYWAADWVEQFYADGITSGCSTDPPLYCPDDLVTRAQMAVFLLRSMYGNGYTPPSAAGIFDDVPVTHWAADWIEQLSDEGITGGCSTNPPLYCPDEIVNRAQMAVFIVRAFGL